MEPEESVRSRVAVLAGLSIIPKINSHFTRSKIMPKVQAVMLW